MPVLTGWGSPAGAATGGPAPELGPSVGIGRVLSVTPAHCWPVVPNPTRSCVYAGEPAGFSHQNVDGPSCSTAVPLLCGVIVGATVGKTEPRVVHPVPFVEPCTSSGGTV